jgi:aquaporin Z
MKKYVTELLGTFLFVFAIGNIVIGGATPAPLFIGLTLAVMVFAGGHISGAHYNPAVTLAVWLRGKCDTKDVVPYIVSQIAGASLAAVTVKYLAGGVEPKAVADIGKAFTAEVIGTLALAWVVLNVATTKANQGNSFYGLAIGCTVASMAAAVGGISGGAFNPAGAIGGVIIGLFKASELWIYLVACPIGGFLAAQIFKNIKADG